MGSKKLCECDIESPFPGYEFCGNGWRCIRCGRPEDKDRTEEWAKRARAKEKAERSKMTTNDRRKTFATPLELWQWAIMEPGKRKAKDKKDQVVFINIQSNGRVELATSEGFVAWLEARLCPLTAVEDEHGVIPEPVKESINREFLVEWLADIGACEDPQDRRGAATQAAQWIEQLIDERIAAATVEMRDIDGVSEWKGGFAAGRYCLKPKGESK